MGSKGNYQQDIFENVSYEGLKSDDLLADMQRDLWNIIVKHYKRSRKQLNTPITLKLVVQFYIPEVAGYYNERKYLFHLTTTYEILNEDNAKEDWRHEKITQIFECHSYSVGFKDISLRTWDINGHYFKKEGRKLGEKTIEPIFKAIENHLK